MARAFWEGTARGGAKTPKGSKDRFAKWKERIDGRSWAFPTQVLSQRLLEGGHFWKEEPAGSVMLPTTV